MPIDFYTVENGKLIHYIRTGDCNRCGECCGIKNTITYSINTSFRDTSVDNAADRDLSSEDWSEWEGFSIFLAQGLWWYFKVIDVVENETPHLCASQDGETKLCKHWNEPEEFPAICRYWPFKQSDLEPFPNCGFEFIRQDEG